MCLRVQISRHLWRCCSSPHMSLFHDFCFWKSLICVVCFSLSQSPYSGDRIMSLTIDFQHIVQEDAMTILSYASPYNVQLELVSGNSKLRSSGSFMKDGSVSPGRQSPLVHPLVRSSSQSDLNTVRGF